MTAQTVQKLDLPEVIDLDSMDNVRDWLLVAMQKGDVELDGGEVQRVATNALLLLVSAHKTAVKFSTNFSIVNASAAFNDAVERLGLSEIFKTFRKGN